MAVRNPRRWVGWCLLLLAVAPRGRPAPADETLQKALAKLQATTANLPSYACIETVERRYFEHGKAASSCEQPPAASTETLQSLDRLRLDVTVADGREIYSWPGATRFDMRDVNEIIRQGPIGTGSFGSHLLAVFFNQRVTYEYAGEQESGGRKLLEYRFRVPLDASRYRVNTGEQWQTIAYQGRFWVDADSLQLERLSLEADSLPPASSICQLTAELEYRNLPIGSDALLLPSRSELRLVFDDQHQTDNVTTFSACRKYQAESQLVFGDEPQTESAAQSRVVRAPLALPIGLPVELALTAPIDMATAAAGDPVAAQVVKPVRRTASNGTLIEAGAVVRGRLTRVERHLLPRPYYLVAISFNRIEWQGTVSPFAARAEENPDLVRELGATATGNGGGFRYWNVGTFLFPSHKPQYVIPAGFQMKWTTLAIRPR